MKSPAGLLVVCVALLSLISVPMGAAGAGRALVRHGPSLQGTIEGNLQQMTAESATMNGGARVTGDWFVPGSPTVRLNGHPTYAGTVDGDGAAAPSNFQITLNGNCTLGHVVRRTDPQSIPAVAAPPRPTGTRNVTINSRSQSAGDFATLRNLSLNGNVGQFVIPPGTYGDFTANGGSGFTLGIEGATQPAVYHLQRLTLNGQSQVRLLGPVVITVANGFAANGSIGTSNRPDWMTLNVFSNGFTLNGGCTVYGYVNAPAGTVIVNGNSQLVGGVTCDRLTVNGGGVLRLIAANSAPTAIGQQVTTRANTPIDLVLQGSDPDGDELSFAVEENPAHGALENLGALSGHVTYRPTAGYSGADQFTFVVLDDLHQSAPAAVRITVEAPPEPPVTEPDHYEIAEDGLLEVPAPGVLANDHSPSGVALTASLAAGTSSGLLTLQPNGGFSYRPAANYVGADSFVYRAFNGVLAAPASAYLLVTPVNDTPVATPQSLSTRENTALPVTLSGADVEDATVGFSIEAQPAHGAVIGSGASVQYLPASGFNGVDRFTFAAIDHEGAKGLAEVEISVAPHNDAPIARWGGQPTALASGVRFNFSATESYDPDGTIARYQWDFDGDGAFDAEGVAPSRDFAEFKFSVQLVVTDNEGATAALTQEIRLNQPPTVSVERPAELAAFYDNERIEIVFAAFDPDGAIDKTELYLGEELIAQLDARARRFTLGPLPAGFYTVRAKAFDQLGAATTSATVGFEVRSRAANFVVRPLERIATLPAVAGAAVPGGEPPAERVNTQQQPLLAENFYSEPVDFTVRLIDNRTGGQTDYLVFDSRTSGEVSAHWEDIASAETKLQGVSNLDDGHQEVPLPFIFEFYGKQYTSMWVGSNGYLQLVEDFEGSNYLNGPLPSPDTLCGLIAPFWDDLLPPGEGVGYGEYRNRGGIYYKALGDRVVVQFSGADDESCGLIRAGSDGCYNFQVILHQNGNIEFQYGAMTGVLDSATVGIQDEMGTRGVQLAYDQPFVASGTAILLKRENTGAPWFTVEPTSGHLASAATEKLAVHFFAKPDFPSGHYEGLIQVDHTQPNLAPYLVRVALDIEEQKPVVRFLVPSSGTERCHFILGDSIPLEVEADDADGAIRTIAVSANGELLATLSSPPYVRQWLPPSAGDYELGALATDNDGFTGAAQPVSITVSPDSDGDLLPDSWELEHFGHLGMDGVGDPDVDGRWNRQELLAGSSPLVYDQVALENIAPEPRIVVTRTSGEAPFELVLDGSSSRDPDGSITLCQWDLDDDGSFEKSGARITHTFAIAGKYPVTLKVSDNRGLARTTRVSIDVKPAGTAIAPVARFEAVPYASPAALWAKLDGTGSTDEDGTIVRYAWDFGDRSTGEGATAEHLYPAVGVYPVVLMVTDNDGKTASITKRVTITHRDQSAFAETDGFLVLDATDCTGTDPRSDTWHWHPQSFAADTAQALAAEMALGHTGVNSEWATLLSAAEVAPSSTLGWDEAAEISWLVNITTPGLYYYAVRCSSWSQGFSLRIGVDGAEKSVGDGDWMGASRQPVWRRGHDLGLLGPGLHRIQIRRGVGAGSISQLVLTPAKEQLPESGSVEPPLAANVRPNAPRKLPVPWIEERPAPSGGPTLLFDGRRSAVDQGHIVRYNWFLVEERIDDLGTAHEEARHLLAESPDCTVRLDDFDGLDLGTTDVPPALVTGVELLVEDDLGRKASARQPIGLVDRLQALAGEGELIIDNAGPDFSAPEDWSRGHAANMWAFYRYFEGGWPEFARQYPEYSFITPLPPGYSTMMTAGYQGEDFHFLKNGEADIRARFTPEIATPGPYLVFIKYPAADYTGLSSSIPGHPTGSRVPVTIHSADGDKTLFVDQRAGSGQWRLLGISRFESGRSGYVEVGGADVGFAFADAIRLVRLPVTPAEQAPVARFTAAAQPDQVVSFDGTSSSGRGAELLVWLWDFGDGRQSRSPQPVHQFDEAGTYAVRLTVIDAQLGWQTSVQTVAVPEVPLNENPVARMALSARRGQVPFTLAADASASSDDLDIVRYEWRTSEGFATTGAKASLTFGVPGVHTITLRTFDRYGQSDAVTLEVEALAAGYAAGHETIVDNRDRLAVLTTGAWQELASGAAYGGSYLAAQAVGDRVVFRPHLPHAGLYQIFWRYAEPAEDVPATIVVSDQSGESVVSFNHSRVAGHWHLLGTFSCANGVQSQVAFTQERPTQALTVDAVKWVAVDAGVTADFTYAAESLVAPAAVAFAGSASAPVVRFTWSYGDGATGTGEHVEHNYTAPGLYPVALTAFDLQGVEARTTRWVRIEPVNLPPQAVAHASTLAGEVPLTVAFDGSGSTDADGIVAYHWAFGDGSEHAGALGTHVFTSAGNQRVTLTVVDARGASSQTTLDIAVGAALLESPSGFAATPIVADPLSLSLQGPAITGASYAWDFGDGQIGTGAQAAHTYAAPGTYEAVLTISLPDGSSQMLRQLVAVPTNGGPADPPDGPRSDPGAAFWLYTPLPQR